MSNDSYDVYFSGAILKENDPKEVKRKIGAMFKLDGEKLDRLFSGKPIPIKKGLDMDRAIKFRVAFRDAGGLVDIVPTGQPAPIHKPPTQARTGEASSMVAQRSNPSNTEMTLADGPMEPESNPDVVSISVPDYALSSPQGFDLTDCAPEVEAVEIPDISSLDLDKSGSDIDRSPDPEPLEIDTSALALDAPGTTLLEQSPSEPPIIDTAALSLSPANQGSLEDCQTPVEPVPIPNLDHLKIDQPDEKDEIKGKAQFKLSED
ncbi:MAG: hypothetical protein KZQ84_04580 [Candidatus Thiodiazotropha sp. (ex Lucinoma borealis)]|nr:hypothetical protein [Candidatus Thiodiazotropha sp. (ex Lucinoma borealis)]